MQIFTTISDYYALLCRLPRLTSGLYCCNKNNVIYFSLCLRSAEQFPLFTSTSPLSVSFSAGLTGNPSVATDMIGLLCTYPRSVRLFLTAFNARPFSLIDFSDKSPHTGSASSERILPSFTVRNPLQFPDPVYSK